MGIFELEALQTVVFSLAAIAMTFIIVRSPGAKARAELRKMKKMRALGLDKPEKPERPTLDQNRMLSQMDRMMQIMENQNKRLDHMEEDREFIKKLMEDK